MKENCNPYCRIPLSWMKYIHDPKMMLIIREIVYIIRPSQQTLTIKCNGYHTFTLGPDEFYFSYVIFSEKTGLTRKELRTRMEILMAEGLAQGFIEKRADGRAQGFSIYKLSLGHFEKNEGIGLGIGFSEEKGIGLGTPLIYNIKNEKDLRFLEKENVEKEKDARPTLESKPKSPPPENPKIVRGEFNAFLLHKERQEELDVFDMICEEHGYKIIREDFRKWRNRYSLEQIMRTLDLMLIAIKKQKRPIESHVRWMQTALKQDWVGKEDRIKMNKAFAKEFKEKNRIKRLLVLEQYCRDEMTGNDYQYFLPHEQFKKLLEDKFITYRGQNS